MNKDFVSELWSRIVSGYSGVHIWAGTNIGEIRNMADMIDYLRKLMEKKKPKNYGDTGRFWGCSLNLSAPILEIDGMSSRTIEIFSSKYTPVIGGPWSIAKSKNFVWNGRLVAPSMFVTFLKGMAIVKNLLGCHTLVRYTLRRVVLSS